MIECKKKQILQAIEAVKYMNEKFFEDESKKKPLIEENPIFLQVTLKKIPPSKLLKIIKVALPNSIIGDTSDVCLITGDLDKNDRKAEIEPTVLHYKDLLKQHGVKENVEVIPLRQLRTEYKAYEAKRQLVAAYDVFLADNKIAGVLPKLLGKFFFRKRKFPIQIDMQSRNLKDLIQKASSSTVFFFSNRGNSCTAEIGNLDMTVKEVKQNILAAIKVLSERVPGAYDNIMGIYVKTLKSKAIPIYMSYTNPNEVKFESLKAKELVEAEELSTLPNKKVKVFRDGRIIVKNCKNESESEDNSDETDGDSCSESADNDERAKTIPETDKMPENLNTVKMTSTNFKGKKSPKRKWASKKNIKQSTTEENKYTKEETRNDNINDVKECKSNPEKDYNQKLKKYSKNCKITVEKDSDVEKEKNSQEETVIDNFTGEEAKLKGNKLAEKQNEIQLEKETVKESKLVEDVSPCVKQSKKNEGIKRSPKKVVTGKREFLKRRQFYKLKKRLKLANELKKKEKESEKRKAAPSPKYGSGWRRKSMRNVLTDV